MSGHLSVAVCIVGAIDVVLDGGALQDAIQSLQKKCSEPLPPQCVNHIDKYLTASLQGVDTLKLEVSVKCMSAIHNKVTKLCKQAKESLRKVRTLRTCSRARWHLLFVSAKATKRSQNKYFWPDDAAALSSTTG